MLTLTPLAAKKIKELADKKNQPNAFLRIRVLPGGCSGFSYEFELSDLSAQGDKFFEQDGAKVAVDNRSYFFLNGSTVDYVQSLMTSGFEIKNPNASSSCACGSSFSL
ncbi:MAG: iron-sulfur cluster assembly accessory protein [Elusimicrobia bacterium]|nr:iron-sulfur cluster assembly accessory protein [Elusimicrobiota bacterium]